MQPTYPMMTPQMQHFAGRGAPMRGPYPAMMQQQQRSGMYQMPPYGAPQSGGRGGRGGPNQGRGGRGGGRGQPFQGGRGQPQLKFNHQARNASTPPSVPVPGVVPPQPNPVPPPVAPQVPPPPANESLTASALASATPEMQKNMIGERLYPLIHASQPELAGKITGMLLEMDNSELLHLLESPDALNAKISEALQVLEAHNATQD